MRSILDFGRTHILGIVVVAVWLVTLSNLVRREMAGFGATPPPAALPEPLEDGDPGHEDWMGVYFQGNKIGYSHSVSRPEGDGVRFEERSFLKIAAQGVPQTVSMKLDARTRRDYTLESFEFELTTGLVSTRIAGRVEGDRLELDLETAGKRSSQSLELDERPALPASLAGILRSRPLEAGAAFSFPTFDPVTLGFRETRARVEGKEAVDLGGEPVPCFRVRTEQAGIDLTLWVDEAGRIRKQESPAGWVMLRETREQALTGGWKAGAPIDMISATSVPSRGRTVSDPYRVSYMSVLLSADSTEGLELDGGRQRHRPGRFQPVNVTREAAVAAGEAPDLPVTDPALRPFLSPDLLVQSDHPEIVRQARAIAGGERNSVLAARAILAWVNDHIEQRAVPSLPNALEVLHRRAGDCNEFTVLYVALARAVGLPARANAGLVYQDGRFYYHAWPEVWAGRWITLDPVFGQMPADATHIRLVTGGIERQVEITRLIGRLKEIHVLDVRYD